MVGDYTCMSHYKENVLQAGIPACSSRRVKWMEIRNMTSASYIPRKMNVMANLLSCHKKWFWLSGLLTLKFVATRTNLIPSDSLLTLVEAMSTSLSNDPRVRELQGGWPFRYWTPCILLAAYPRYVYYNSFSVDQCHIRMCHRAVAWTSIVTCVYAIGQRGLRWRLRLSWDEKVRTSVLFRKNYSLTGLEGRYVGFTDNFHLFLLKGYHPQAHGYLFLRSCGGCLIDSVTPDMQPFILW